LLDEALAIIKKTRERWWEAELYRLKGELIMDLPPSYQSEAEKHFQKAIDVARKQQAKSLELRTAVSLSRLWQGQGKGDAGRRLLAEIYNWFKEGFETPDLKEAKEVLEEIS